MFKQITQGNPIYRTIAAFLSVAFLANTILPPTISWAQVLTPPTVLNLPAPGTMVTMTPAFMPPMVQGITIYPQNPLEFDFIVSQGDEKIQGDALKEESKKLIKYFLASLTTPEKELWVNLSPYEKDRIIPQSFGQTEMGRDLLAQDYILKQLSASLMYPEDPLGKKFWDRVYAKAQAMYGTTNIPMNTFNKIWIVPSKAVVYEHNNSAFVVESHLKVMLEEDYLALEKNLNNTQLGTDQLVNADAKIVSGVTSAVVREVLIPEIEKEVNAGKTFANLRQIFNSMILATWYKQNLKEGLLGQVYADKNKIKGVDVADKEIKDKIYNQYVMALKKGVYNYIKEDYDPATQQSIPRKYFSGGVVGSFAPAGGIKTITDPAALTPAQAAHVPTQDVVREQVSLTTVDADQQKNIGATEQNPAMPQQVSPAIDHSAQALDEQKDKSTNEPNQTNTGDSNSSAMALAPISLLGASLWSFASNHPILAGIAGIVIAAISYTAGEKVFSLVWRIISPKSWYEHNITDKGSVEALRKLGVDNYEILEDYVKALSGWWYKKYLVEDAVNFIGSNDFDNPRAAGPMLKILSESAHPVVERALRRIGVGDDQIFDAYVKTFFSGRGLGAIENSTSFILSSRREEAKLLWDVLSKLKERVPQAAESTYYSVLRKAMQYRNEGYDFVASYRSWKGAGNPEEITISRGKRIKSNDNGLNSSFMAFAPTGLLGVATDSFIHNGQLADVSFVDSLMQFTSNHPILASIAGVALIGSLAWGLFIYWKNSTVSGNIWRMNYDGDKDAKEFLIKLGKENIVLEREKLEKKVRQMIIDQVGEQYAYLIHDLTIAKAIRYLKAYGGFIINYVGEQGHMEGDYSDPVTASYYPWMEPDLNKKWIVEVSEYLEIVRGIPPTSVQQVISEEQAKVRGPIDTSSLNHPLNSRIISPRNLQQILNNGAIDVTTIKDERLKEFLNFLQSKGLSDIIIFGGAVRDTLLDRQANDIDFTIKVNVPLAYVDLEDAVIFYRTDIVLERLSRALGIPKSSFFNLDNPPQFAGVSLNYLGPVKNKSQDGQSQIAVRSFFDKDTGEMVSSFTTPEILSIGLDSTGQLYGYKGPLKSWASSIARLRGDKTKGQVLPRSVVKLLRLKHEFGLTIPAEDYASFQGVRKEQYDVFSGNKYLQDDIRKVINTAQNPEAASSELKELGFTVIESPKVPVVLSSISPAAANQQKPVDAEELSSKTSALDFSALTDVQVKLKRNPIAEEPSPMELDASIDNGRNEKIEYITYIPPEVIMVPLAQNNVNIAGLAFQKPSSNHANKDTVSKKEGGINLNPALWDLNIRRDGNGVPLPLPQVPMQNIQIQGLTPVIINVTAVLNLSSLLGVEQKEQQQAGSLKNLTGEQAKGTASISREQIAVREEELVYSKN